MTLTAQQADELKRIVEQRRAALARDFGSDLHRLREDRLENLVGAVPDAGDEAVQSLIQDLDQAEASRDLSELRMLEAAAQRIADGSYGTCIQCGQDIGFQRLRATPAAERCIQCQTLFEKTHAQKGVRGSSL